MDRRPFGVPPHPQYPPSAEYYGGHYNRHYDSYRPPEIWNGHPQPRPDTHRLSNPALPSPVPPTPPSYYHYRGYGADIPIAVRYVDPRDPMIPHHLDQIPLQASYPAQSVLGPPQRQESHRPHSDDFRDPFEDQDPRRRHGSTSLDLQDQYNNARHRRAGHASVPDPFDQPIVSPQPRRLLSPELWWDTNHERTTSSFLDGYSSDSEARSPGSGMVSRNTLNQPSSSSSATRCILCDRVGHASHDCRLAHWDESSPEANAGTPDSVSEDVAEIEKRENYEQLAGKLSHICWNMVPDPDQPPESHKTMMQHILRILSQNPDNVEIVYNYMFGEEFQNKWLCLKAMCDTQWQGVVWLVDGACRYCDDPHGAEPVTLCYRIQPNRNNNALYREVGVVRT
ncbi:hypothetical protein V8F20_000086 [Naviculisporaceae sp. PSN 640]